MPPILPPRQPKADEMELPLRPPKPKEKLPPTQGTLEKENDEKEDYPLLPAEVEEFLPLQPKENKKETMIEKVKEFLDKANTGKPHVRKEIDQCSECQLENYQREQIVPRGILFCYMCKMYREKIHYCTKMKYFYNIDYQNLIIIEGNNPDEVEATHARGGRVEMFDSLKDMRLALWYKKDKKGTINN